MKETTPRSSGDISTNPVDYLDLPECSWRADEQIAERLKLAGDETLCCSPRIHAFDYASVTEPVRGTKILSAYCHQCPFRNESIPTPLYRSLMTRRWPDRSAEKASLRTRARRLTNQLVYTIRDWYEKRKNPLASRSVFRERSKVCGGCESAQPPEKPSYCSECSCKLTFAARLKSKTCPLQLWPGESNEANGIAIAERSDDEAKRLRKAYAEETVDSPRDE